MKAAVLEDLDWAADAAEAIQKVAAMGIEFDAYDLSEKAGLREPPHHNMWGSVFKSASHQGLIVRVGFHESRRPGRKAGLCRVWRGK